MEFRLFSSSHSVGCGLDGSDPPKSTSSSKFPVWAGVGDLPALAIRFSTLRDLRSLIGGPVAVAWLVPCQLILLSSVQEQSDCSGLLQAVGLHLLRSQAQHMTATALEFRIV